MLRKLTTLLAFATLIIIGSAGHSFARPDTAWTRWYGDTGDEEVSSVVQISDGGFIIAGYTSSYGAGAKDIWIVKADAQGDTVWTRTYGGTGDDIGRSVRQTSDGGYIIAGQTNSFGAGNADLWLIKTDADGDSLWAKTYGGTASDVGNSVRQTQDGGYIIAGTTASFAVAYDDVWLLKTDSAGDTLWTKNWDVSNNADRGTEVQQTHDGGYIVVGHSYYTPGGNILDFTLFKTDSLGNLLWMEIYGEREDQRGASVDQTSDRGYILTGYSATSGVIDPDVYVVKTDSVGDTTWTRTYGGSGWEEGYLVRKATGGGYFITGKTNSFGAGGFDVWVLKTDSNGDTLWAKTYGGTSDDVAYSGQQTADGGYIIAGYTESYGAGGKDVFLIRLAYPRVLSTTPAQNQLNVPVSTDISVTFDVDMDQTTINDSTFLVNARSTGLHTGVITYDGPTKTATFDPSEDFDEGEVVTVTLTTAIQSSGGTPLGTAYLWSFTSVVYDGSGTFTPDSVYAVGDVSYSVFSADLDGDGDLDLAVANGGYSNVSVLLNNGDGTFAAHSVYPVGSWPHSVFSADLDGDGDLDLATANQVSANVSVLLNNGDGTFAAHSVYPVEYYPASLFSADLDGDGDQDLATGNGGSDNVSVLLNNGDGTFAPPSVYAVGDGPYLVFSADLDGDGDLDLVTANQISANVSVLLNNGDGTFAAHSIYPAGSWPRSVFSADLDGDGDLDLVTANSGTDNVSVLLNNGDGTFTSDSVYAVGDAPYSVFSADLDGDGYLDLATANGASDNVSVLLNNGDGTFAPQSVYAVGDGPYQVFSADLDGDGDLDLATVNQISDNVSVLLNESIPHLVYTSPPQNELNVPISTNISATFDVDMDEATINDSTFVVNARSTGLHAGTITYDEPTRTASFDPTEDFEEGEVVSVVLTTSIKSSEGISLDSIYCWSFTLEVSNGAGAFATDSSYSVGDNPQSVFAADFDGDGDLDLATADYWSNGISILLNNGDATFAEHSVYQTGPNPYSVFAADLDGDGDMDLATALNPDSASVLLNQGNGTFGFHSSYYVGYNPHSIFAEDLDGDGDIDLTTANKYSNDVAVLLNVGDGTFDECSAYPVGTDPLSVFAADLDGDADFDLAVANSWSNNVSVLLNNGDGSFTPDSTYPVFAFPRSVFAADFDADSDLDLVTADSGSSTLSVLLNNGDGTFAPYSIYTVTSDAFSVFATDLDGDGDLDLSAACWGSDAVSVLLNNGNGTFGSSSSYAVGDYPLSIFAADLDGDGDLDLATANQESDNVSILLNQPKPRVISTSPSPNELDASPSTNISVTFDIDMDETTITNSTFVVNARSTGLHQGTITYDSPTKTATLDPFNNFQQGELVSAVLTTGIRSSYGAHLDSSYVWCFTSTADCGSGIFAPDSAYPADSLATSVCAADFDGDGDLDLACANEWTAGVSVLLNQGDGTFAPQSQYPVGASDPVSIFAADLDGDGDIDLATANDHGTVSVIYNLGNGTFDYEPWVWSLPYVPPLSIFAADLDGDGDIDLATANGDEHLFLGSVSVLLNNGNYEFSYHWDSWPWDFLYYSVCAADFDADGDLDLAVGADFDVWIFSNNGDATFMLDSIYEAGSGIYSVSAADLDGDGHVDLATASYNHSQVSVLLNQGDGTFSAPSAYGVDNYPYSLFAADLDGDGDIDLSTVNDRSDNVSVLLNYGDGTFIPYATYSVGDEPRSVFAADLDGDGDLDLATANAYSFDVSVLLNVLRGDANGNGAVEPGDIVYLINYLFRNDPPPDPYQTGDCNCDGEVDPGDVVYLINYLFRGWPPPSC
jgi:hypothetical protein